MNSIPSYRPSPARKAPAQRQSKKWQTTNQRATPRSRTLTTARKRKNSSKTSFSSASARIGAHLLQQSRTGNNQKTKQPPHGHGRYAPPRVSAHICSNKAELGTPKRPSKCPMGTEDTRPRAYRRTFAPTKPNWERQKDQANALTRKTSAFFLFLSPRLPRRRCRSIRPSSAPMSFL